jgi:hypothetical protein
VPLRGCMSIAFAAGRAPHQQRLTSGTATFNGMLVYGSWLALSGDKGKLYA